MHGTIQKQNNEQGDTVVICLNSWWIYVEYMEEYIVLCARI